MLSNKEIAQKAIATIKERGWTKGQSEDGPGGPVCLIGAIHVAIYGEANPGSLHDVACEYFMKNAVFPIAPFNKHCETGWNDKPERTVEEVIALLEQIQ